MPKNQMVGHFSLLYIPYFTPVLKFRNLNYKRQIFFIFPNNFCLSENELNCKCTTFVAVLYIPVVNNCQENKSLILKHKRDTSLKVMWISISHIIVACYLGIYSSTINFNYANCCLWRLNCSKKLCFFSLCKLFGFKVYYVHNPNIPNLHSILQKFMARNKYQHYKAGAFDH